MTERFIIAGGAGFIGSHFVDHLLADPGVGRVTIYDNYSSGRRWHHAAHDDDGRFAAVEGDVRDLDRLRDAMDRHDVVIHLASNPDIAAAAANPAIDFDQGTTLTHNVLEAMRTTTARRILYASGSGVYGDLGHLEVPEDHGPLQPVSTYGASKLAGEALVSAYAAMFGLTACVLRFGNVVGARQTHGVGFDFVRRLRKDPTCLTILGDGSQSKSYIDVGDVVSAVLLAHRSASQPDQAYNVATGDYITVTEIAGLAVDVLGLDPTTVRFNYTGGDRGWKGDVPVVRLDTRRIRDLGWRPSAGSAEALANAMRALAQEDDAGLL
ncbi:MAG: NAD-dependent epimerase/dehydratase family protein [Acidimicrobiales bacterium]